MRGKRIKNLELRQVSSLDNHKYWEIVQYQPNEWYHQYDKVEWDEKRGMYRVFAPELSYYISKDLVDRLDETCYTLCTFMFYRDDEEIPDVVTVGDRPFREEVDITIFKKLCYHFYNEWERDKAKEEDYE